MYLGNKKGDVNWFIVSLIVIIVSLAVLVMIVLRFNFTSDTDRTACMESAVLKASLPDTGDIKNVVNLKCKTKRICVTTNVVAKGECEDGLGSTYSTYRLSGSTEAQENQIKMVLAREMAECWSMLGEGNLQIFTTDITTNPINAKAVICSRVMFDKTVTSKFDSVSGMNNYLLTHKVPGKDISYWDYFRNADDGDTLQLLTGNMVVGSTLDDNLDLTKLKAVFYLESSVSKLGGAIGTVSAVGGTALLLGSFGGAGFKGAAILGRVFTGGLKVGSALGPIAILSGAGYIGKEIGQDLYKDYFAPEFGTDQDSVAGVFLTDYTVDGFKNFEDKKISFESIS